jgi:hypothetical protein
VFADDPRAGGDAQQLVVTNVGGQATGVLDAAEIVAGGAPEFALDAGTCIGTLAPAATCEITVTFTADNGGGVAVVPSQASISASPGGTATADLTGTEHDTTQIALVGTPSTPYFDSNEQDGINAHTYIVQNNTAFVMTELEVSIDNPGTGSGFFLLNPNNCAATSVLAPGASCTFNVEFVDQSGSGETTNAELVVTAAFSDDVVDQLVGHSTGIPNTMSIHPDIGNASDSMSEPGTDDDAIPVLVTVTNNGSAATGPLGFTLVQTGTQSDFEIREVGLGCLGEVLDPGASCQFTVGFDPVPGTSEPHELRIEIRGAPGGYVQTVITGVALP